MSRPRRVATTKRAETYRHEDEAPLRPDVGTQAQFKQRKPPKTYKYDSSLSPALDWDGQNPARERGEELIRRIQEAESLEEARAAADELARLGRPFLDWAGKAERLSFDVPTLPLFVHERLSTKAILETLKGHERDRQMELQLFADPQLPLHQQLAAYEHPGPWANRLILGDSLVVMNSLLEYEGLGGQVQAIYIDPPYAVEFGSNFQPFVRKRDVRNNDDIDMTREPEMVKAYRDTWQLGLHSYLTYLRDRFLVARELLTPSGSLFVQIGDEVVHVVRAILDEVFGADCYVVTIAVKKKGGQRSGLLDPVNDYVLWYTKRPRESARPGDIKFNAIFAPRELDAETLDEFNRVELADGSQFPLGAVPDTEGVTFDYRLRPTQLFKDHPGARLFRVYPLTGGGVYRTQSVPYTHDGTTFSPGANQSWKHSAFTDDGSPSGMDRLAAADRLVAGDSTWGFKRYLDDFPFKSMSNWWDRLGGASKPTYVVQTNTEIVRRCLLMTTDPGDLVLDPTCGSGTTAYVAEQWGRRWITIDTSRVPLALTRQRLLTATFPYYRLNDEAKGPAAGFSYQPPRGVVEHTTSSTIANEEPAIQEVIVDRPEVDSKITRVTGPFVVEATIPSPVDVDGDGTEDSGIPQDAGYVDRMLEALRRNPVIQLGGNQRLELRNVKPPARSLYLSAEAGLDPDGAPVAIVFGPENGAISEKLIYEAVTEAHMKHFDHLLLIGFAIEPNAREFVHKGEKMSPIPITYVQATPDLVMGDLLKTTRSSQLFSIAGLPDVAVRKVPDDRYEVELRGLDTFDPTSFEVQHRSGDDVPAWFLDTDWNELSFHVSQAFFPRTAAWDGLKRALKSEYEDSVWDHLAGTTSAPFGAGEHRRIAVKVIDDRGNELLVVKSLDEAE